MLLVTAATVASPLKTEYNSALLYLSFILPDSLKYKQSLDLKKTIESRLPKKFFVKKTNIPIDTFKSVNLAYVPSPGGVAIDSKGNTYISSFKNNSIFKITPDGNKEEIKNDNVLSGPLGLAVDNNDNIYIAN